MDDIVRELTEYRDLYHQRPIPIGNQHEMAEIVRREDLEVSALLGRAAWEITSLRQLLFRETAEKDTLEMQNSSMDAIMKELKISIDRIKATVGEIAEAMPKGQA